MFVQSLGVVILVLKIIFVIPLLSDISNNCA